jgi:YD repeat-containing protein
MTKQLILTAFLTGLCLTTASGLQTAYTYDDAGRLTGADYGGGASVAYAYDDNGNLLQRTVTAGGAVTYTLIYLAGAGGTVDGLPVVTQQVAQGQSGAAVAAAGDAAGGLFRVWSDGRTDGTRTDTDVLSNLTVTARFRSAGGADLDWYAARGFAPGGGEGWADVDARAVPDKGTTLLHENVADTDPADPADVFRLLAISNGQPASVTFAPASTARVYTLQATTNLPAGAWADVPGQGPRPGAGGADAMTDDSERPARFYRVKVEVP